MIVGGGKLHPYVGPALFPLTDSAERRLQTRKLL